MAKTHKTAGGQPVYFTVPEDWHADMKVWLEGKRGVPIKQLAFQGMTLLMALDPMLAAWFLSTGPGDPTYQAALSLLTGVCDRVRRYAREAAAAVENEQVERVLDEARAGAREAARSRRRRQSS